MATEPHTHPEQHPPAREREVIVTNTDGGRSGMSGALVAVLAIVVIAIVGILIVNAIGSAADNMDAPSVDVPEEVNVDVSGGGGGQ